MASPYTADTPKLKLKLDGSVGLADRKPPITDAEFDSEVIGYEDPHSNADLKITLKVWFKQMDPPASPAGKPVNYVKAWGTDPQTLLRPGFNDGDFAAFKRIVLEEANTFWNGKMWLVTPNNYDGLDWLPIPYAHKIRPNIHCLLNVIEATGPNTAHLIIACWRLATGTDSNSFGSSSAEYDNYDVLSHAYHAHVNIGSAVGGGTDTIATGTALTPQMTVWHEMGHAIGQRHIASGVAGCAGGGGNAEYGDCTAATPSMARNIMGIGEQLSAYNGSSWAKRMVKHTNGTTAEADWAIWTVRPGPRDVR